MKKESYKVWTRNRETNELKLRRATAYTADEAIDKVMDRLEYPWTIARAETMAEYEKH